MTAPTPPAELPRTVDAPSDDARSSGPPSGSDGRPDLGVTREAPVIPRPSDQTVVPTGAAAITAEGTGEIPNAGETSSKVRRLGPFTMGRRLGVGGMGVVYAAQYREGKGPAAGRTVAVKVLTPSLAADPKVRKRFSREMEIFKKLRHPHIVRYFGGGQTGGKLFYAMELLPGGSLEDQLREGGPVDWRRAVDFAAQTADALQHAHSCGVIHRDLKPANLFVDAAGNLKLGDFGIARDANATALTAAGRTVGTYAYMAPEQISSALEVGPKTDLYALGCVLHEMLVGSPPFAAQNPAKLLHAHMTEPPPRVRSSDCPRWLADLVDSMLAKDPGDRPFDALAVRELLRERAEQEATRSVIGRTAAARTAAAGSTAADARTQRDVARKLLGRKKKRRKGRAVPVYERAWFLAAILLVMAAGVTWAAWPPGEEELYTNAAALMASEDVYAWQAAREDYIAPLLDRFPDSEHAPEAQGWVDRIEVNILRRQLQTKASSVFRAPENELERRYLEVDRLVDFGDLWAASEQVDVLRELLKDNAYLEREEIAPTRARYYGLLLDQRAVELDADLREVAVDRRAFVADTLRAAEVAQAAGNVADARDKWEGVREFYTGVPELAPHVKFAKARLDGDTSPPPAFLAEPPPAEPPPTDPADVPTVEPGPE